MQNNKRKVPIIFNKTIPAGQSKTLTYELPHDATVERVFGNFTEGSNDELELDFYVQRLNGSWNNMFVVAEGSEGFISGNDSEVDEELTIEALRSEKIILIANNKSAIDLRLNFRVMVDYMKGERRA